MKKDTFPAFILPSKRTPGKDVSIPHTTANLPSIERVFILPYKTTVQAD
jgi:hypothetical protein